MYFIPCYILRALVPLERQRDLEKRIKKPIFLFLFIYLFFFCLLSAFRATPAACGGSQERGPIRATATGLCHSNAGSKPRLRPTLQLTATPDP